MKTKLHKYLSSLAALSNEQLLCEASSLVQRGNRTTAQLLAHLGEVERRDLHLALGHPSMFAYATEALHLSEGAAFDRIRAARLARRFPRILPLVADGSVHLAALRLLAAHLTDENCDELLAAARFQSKAAVEKLLAARRPQPPVPTQIRKRPAPSAPAVERSPSSPASGGGNSASPQPSPSPSAVVAPLGEATYKVQFTASAQLHQKLQRAQDLLRHSVPNGDPAQVFERALDTLIADLEKKQNGRTDRPQQKRRAVKPGSRHIPNAVKREVMRRDGGQCTFVGCNGRRCQSRSLLQFHHIVPYAKGGPATVENIALRCAPHNRHEGRLVFGEARPGTSREREGGLRTRGG